MFHSLIWYQLIVNIFLQPSIVEIANDQILVRSSTEGDRSIHEIEPNHRTIQPVLKWAGGKQWLAIAAKYLAPPKWNGRYHEPFVGAGSFFFSTQPDRAWLSDSNEDLMTTYLALRDSSDKVIRILSKYPYDEDFYYRLRKTQPRTIHTIAARFIYLNRTCWNGLYRVNNKGKFNTPFGKISGTIICHEERIHAASRSLATARLKTCDFAQTLSHAKENDFVYLDPPYITGHANNGFLRYNRKLFSWNDQIRLAKWAVRLAEKGVNVLISNADHSPVVELYKGFCYYRISRRNEIAGKVSSRGMVTEALLSTYPIINHKTQIVA